MRRHGFLDQILDQCDRALKTLSNAYPGHGEYPGAEQPSQLDESERQHVIGLMRINRVGEVAAQALYNGHALASKNPDTVSFMIEAGIEERDHLRWCQQRLDELGGRPSYFDPLWYAGAWTLGFVSAKLGDAYGLGFVVETERQVESHLEEHLAQLPESDPRTRAILETMRTDEIEHANHAEKLGADPVPPLIQVGMDIMATLMKRLAYHL